MEPATAYTSGLRPAMKKRTTIHSLTHDVLSMVFSLLNLVELVRCSAVCKSWSGAIDKLKLLQIQYWKQQGNHTSPLDISALSGRSLKIQLGKLAMNQHRYSLQEGHVDICQWKGHSIGVDQCRMKMGMILTGVGDRVMRLWSAESYKCMDEYILPDKAPLLDFDFDESKVVGLVGTRICIWRRFGDRSISSSRKGLFMKGLCMRYVDPVAVVGCEDGKARVFDMYSRNCSQIIKIYDGPLACLSLTEDQLILSGSLRGNIFISDLSSGEQIARLQSSPLTACMRSLCVKPRSHLLFAGSDEGYASCWDLRMMKNIWERRVCPNVIYSLDHLQSDTSTLVVGGIDGLLHVLDQNSGKELSWIITNESSSELNCSRHGYGVIVEKKGKRSSENTRIDLINKACRPSITCLAVGMQKIVTTHNDKFIRVWRFNE